MKTIKTALVTLAVLGTAACRPEISCTVKVDSAGGIKNPALHALAIQSFSAIRLIGWSNVEFTLDDVAMNYVIYELNEGGSIGNGYVGVALSGRGAKLAGLPGKMLLQATDDATGQVVAQQTFSYSVSGSRLVLDSPQSADNWIKANSFTSRSLTLGVPDLAVDTASSNNGQPVTVSVNFVYQGTSYASDSTTFNVDHSSCLTCVLR